jgi:5-formyltetrahydrofolate cyclo-ligase
MTVERDALRRELRARRRALPAAERIAGADALAARLAALPFFPATGYVAGYWAMDGEIGLHSWQLRLPTGVVYCLPVLADDETLRFAPWRPGDELVTNRYGIPEPDVDPRSGLPAADMYLIVVPLVGFDAAGHRLGMGGGWYDRTLAARLQRPAPPWLVGVGFETQRVESIGAQAWDVPLDAICTERDTLLPSPSSLDVLQ